MVITRIVSSIENEGSEKESEKSMNVVTEVENTLFQELYAPETIDVGAVDLVKRFIYAQPSQQAWNSDTFPNKSFRELFMKYNTPIPSSAAVERMFSLGKDIMRPKRSRLSDKHFEMLVFLQGNKLCR